MFFNFPDLKLYLALRRQRPEEASAGGRGSLRLEALVRSRRYITRMLILSTQHTLQSVYSCQRATDSVYLERTLTRSPVVTCSHMGLPLDC